jgi:hypothetical protein
MAKLAVGFNVAEAGRGESRGRISRKKNGRATFGGTAVGSHGSSSPALAWGQTLLVSGEEIVSADGYQKQTLCLQKIEANPRHLRSIFFSFCDAEPLKVPNSATFR